MPFIDHPKVRAYAEQIDPLQLQEFPGAHHGILNETVHREVAAAIIDFVEEQAGLQRQFRMKPDCSTAH